MFDRVLKEAEFVDVLQNRRSSKFRKFNKKKPVFESLLSKKSLKFAKYLRTPLKTTPVVASVLNTPLLDI